MHPYPWRPCYHSHFEEERFASDRHKIFLIFPQYEHGGDRPHVARSISVLKTIQAVAVISSRRLLFVTDIVMGLANVAHH